MKYLIHIILFFILILAISCSPIKNELIPTYNKGGYTIEIIKNNSNNSSNLFITGKAYDVITGKPIANAELILGCYKRKTSLKGDYSFSIDNSNDTPPLFIKVSTIGYKRVETGFFKRKKGNKMKIDFYLTEDDRPFIDCLVTNKNQ